MVCGHDLPDHTGVTWSAEMRQPYAVRSVSKRYMPPISNSVSASPEESAIATNMLA